MKNCDCTEAKRPASWPLFRPMTACQFLEFMDEDSPLIADFAIDADQEPSIVLYMFHQHLILKDQNKLFYALQLTFNIKFEVIEASKRSQETQLIGFRLLSEVGQSITFYGSQAASYSANLKRIINVEGFRKKFKPIRIIGSGKSATVYEVERIADKHKFAVKAFNKYEISKNQELKRSLINQISVLRSLNKQHHPNVLRLQSVYEQQNFYYLIFEFLEGKNLLQIFKQKSLAQKDVKIVMEGLLRGVAHLSKNRVMHRDLKPQNVMIRKGTLEPVIIDLGLSTTVDLPEYIFFRCGTPGYVAPEIIKLTESTHLEPTCDMFSLGAIFHFLLTGHPLFTGANFSEVSQNNFDLNIDLTVDDDTQIDRQGYHLLQQMLILDPDKRIKADQALEHAYFGKSSSKRVPTFVQKEAKSPRSPAQTNVSRSPNQSVKSNLRKGSFFV